MRISDWSSDVCSSDLLASVLACVLGGQRLVARVCAPQVLGGLLVEAAHAVAPAKRSAAGCRAIRSRWVGRSVSTASASAMRAAACAMRAASSGDRSEEHTSELQSLMRISYAVFCLKKKK